MKGDFQVGSLSKIMNSALIRDLTLKAWMEKGRNKKTIAFCAGVKHAHQLAYDFANHGITSDVIDGRTINRKDILQRFHKGDIKVLTNFGVLTEGFDDPKIECILFARPTTSPLVYTQCIGRGLRPSQGIKTCTIIDIIDRSTHQLQYGAGDMCGLPRNWKSNGRDPYRESHAISQIKTSDPETFMKIKSAGSLEEIQSVLMNVPSEYVTAGLDGEPMLYYAFENEKTVYQNAKEQAKKLLQQTDAPFRRIYENPTGDDKIIKISLASPEINNERYAYLKWHLENVTGWIIEYTEGQKKINPKALLRSMLSNRKQLKKFAYNPESNTVTALITKLTDRELSEITEKFNDETGINLTVKCQMSFNF